jgi:hypothetical protein
MGEMAAEGKYGNGNAGKVHSKVHATLLGTQGDSDLCDQAVETFSMGT